MSQSMDNTFWRSLAVEVQHLLADGGVFQQIVSARASTKRVGDVSFYAIICRIDLAIRISRCF